MRLNRKMPRANIAANRTPIAVSPRSWPWRVTQPMASAVATDAIAAPR
jgi:hypothetical protein